MKQRRWASLALCVAVTAALGACGPDTAGTGTEGAVEAASQETAPAAAETEEAPASASASDAAVSAEETVETQETSETDSASEAASADEEPEKVPRGDGLIRYTYQNHPVELRDGETGLSVGNYYTIELDAQDQERYPKLDAWISEYNEDREKSMLEYIAGTEEEAVEMFSSGWGIKFEEDYEFLPSRADEKAFSFASSDYTYLGGAHGYMGFSSVNIDPATGENISFSDVVESTNRLPDLIYSELLRQNDDLVSYFKGNDADKDKLMELIRESLLNDAENLVWTLEADGGIQIYFHDYSMGTYAAGARTVKINWINHPEIFSAKYAPEGSAPEIKYLATPADEDSVKYIESKSHVKKDAES